MRKEKWKKRISIDYPRESAFYRRTVLAAIYCACYFSLFSFLTIISPLMGVCRCFVFGCLCLQSMRNSCWWPFFLSSFSIDSLFLHSELCACKMRMINKYPIMYWLWLWCRCIIVLCVPLVLATPLPPPRLTRGNRACTHKTARWRRGFGVHHSIFNALLCFCRLYMHHRCLCLLYTYLLLFSAKKRRANEKCCYSSSEGRKKGYFDSRQWDVIWLTFISLCLRSHSWALSPSFCLACRSISVFRTDRANTQQNKNTSYQSIRWPSFDVVVFLFSIASNGTS